MATVKQFADLADVSPRTVQRWIERAGKAQGKTFPSGVHSTIDETLIVHLEEQAGLRRAEKPLPNNSEHKPKEVKERAAKPGRMSLRAVLPILPLPMLGLAASYGVYFFAVQFAPPFVAIGEAAAFELTYIGLAAMSNLTDRQQIVARRVSAGAVAVSVIYNTFAGVIHFQPNILTDLPPTILWIVAVVHGSPMAILAFFVADLIFHQKK